MRAEEQSRRHQEEADSQAPEFPEDVKVSLGRAVQADLSDLQLVQFCSVSPATPTDVMRAYLRRLRNAALARQALQVTRQLYEAAKSGEIQVLTAQASSVREELRARQESDVRGLIDRLDKKAALVIGPGRGWGWLSGKLQERRILPEVVAKARAYYSTLLSKEDDLAWQLAVTGGAKEHYETYLAASPEGRYVSAAVQRIEEADDDTLWEMARGKETIEAMEKYLALSEIGWHAEEAKACITRMKDERVWQAAVRQGTINAFQQYLKRTVTREHADEAEERIVGLSEELAWQEALGAKTVPAYRQYLENWPAGAHAKRAKASIDAADNKVWQSARARGSLNAYCEYLSLFPDGHHAAEADNKMWLKVRTSDLQTAYFRYLHWLPTGLHSGEAKERIAIMDKNAWESALTVASTATYNEYLLQYPEGAYAGEARRLIAADEASWSICKAEASVDSYEGYLGSFPKGCHAEEARALLAHALRKRLVRDMGNVLLRRRYLRVRTPQLKQLDGGTRMCTHLCRLLFSLLFSDFGWLLLFVGCEAILSLSARLGDATTAGLLLWYIVAIVTIVVFEPELDELSTLSRVYGPLPLRACLRRSKPGWRKRILAEIRGENRKKWAGRGGA